MSSILEKYGSIDDFIDNLVSSPPEVQNFYKLDVESDDYESGFKILVEIFTKSMKYLYGDNKGKVDLDKMDKTDLDKMSKYFNSFGFNLFVEKIEGINITSYGATENKPINENDLKAQCLKIQTKDNMYVIYFDYLTIN